MSLLNILLEKTIKILMRKRGKLQIYKNETLINYNIKEMFSQEEGLLKHVYKYINIYCLYKISCPKNYSQTLRTIL